MSRPGQGFQKLSLGITLFVFLILTQSVLCSIDGNDIAIDVTPTNLDITESELNIYGELRSTPSPFDYNLDDDQSRDFTEEDELFSTTATYVNISKATDEESTSTTPSSNKDVESTTVQTANFTDIPDNSKLHLAAQLGDEEAVKQLIANGADVNANHKNYESPLLSAALGSDKNVSLGIIKTLIENGADVFFVTNAKISNSTFFHTFLGRGVALTPSQFHDIFAYLISKNMTNLFNKPRSSDGANPVQMAVERCEVEPRTLELLHENGADFQMLDRNRNSILTYAVTGNRSTNLLSRLIQLGAPWRNLNRNGQSCLHTAAYKCHVDGVKYFVELGLDINEADAGGETPLMYAVVCSNSEQNSLETVLVLVENGANVNARNYNLGTPLIKAAYFPRGEENATLNILKYLIENGADIYAYDPVKRNFLHVLVDNPPSVTPVQFHYVVEYLISEDMTDLFGLPGWYLDDSAVNVAVGNMELENRTLDRLKRNGIDLGFKNAEGTSILGRAVQGKRSLKLVEYLIELGVDWRDSDIVGRNLLHFAAAFDNVDAAKYFLERGVPVNAFDFHGNSPLHYAASRGNEHGLEIVRILVEGGANVNGRSRGKDTPLHAAVFCSRNKTKCLEIIKYLIDSSADIYIKDGLGRTFLHMLVDGDTSMTPSQYHDIATFLISRNLTEIFTVPGWPSGTILFQKALKTIEVERETLSLLQKNGIKLDTSTNTGDSVLILPIAGRRSTRLMNDMIDMGVNWRHLNHNQSVLHLAAFFSHTEAVKLFLKMGLDVNGQDIFGNTPLHQVVKRGQENVLETVLILIGNGANVGIEDEKGRTPLDIISRRDDIGRVERDSLIQLLRYHHALNKRYIL